MKWCVCGKGGSGKSTIVTLLALGLRGKGRSLIVLDSDESNTSLFRMLGLPAPPRPLMDLAGGRQRIQQGMIMRFVAGEEEPAMSIWARESLTGDALPVDYVAARDGIKLVATGKIHQALEGCACAMGTVSREFLKLFRTGENEILLADMEAGIEHFGRGIEAGVDGVIAVAEPSLESLTLAKKIMELSRASGAEFLGTVVNKANSREQEWALKENLAELGVPVLGVLAVHPEIQAAGLQGLPLAAAMCPELERVCDALLALASGGAR